MAPRDTYWELTYNIANYHVAGTDGPIVQCSLLVFTIFEVLEGPIFGGNELEMSNCN
jgi:hypothetical protein